MECKHPICVLRSNADGRCLIPTRPLANGPQIGWAPRPDVPPARIEKATELLAGLGRDALVEVYEWEIKRRAVTDVIDALAKIAEAEAQAIRDSRSDEEADQREAKLLAQIRDLVLGRDAR